jgi:hypothetical protein
VRVGSGADCEEDDEEEGLEVEESGLWEGVGAWLAGCLGGGGKGVVDDGGLRTMIVKVPRWLPGDGEIERERGLRECETDGVGGSSFVALSLF